MSLRWARWFNGQWYMNPFDLTYEQINELSSIILSHDIRIDEYSVKFWTHYNWGYTFEEDFFDSNFHEIQAHYDCPSGYPRWKQIESQYGAMSLPSRSNG